MVIGVMQMMNKLNGKPFQENDRNSLEVWKYKFSICLNLSYMIMVFIFFVFNVMFFVPYQIYMYIVGHKKNKTRLFLW